MNDSGVDPLLLGLAAGQPQAFAVLYDRFGRRLFRAALGVLGRPEDAEDAVQEVFVSMVRSRHKLAQVRDLAAYLFAALRRTAARQAVRRGRQPVARESLEDVTAAGNRQPDACRSDRIERALAALPPEQREVIALKIDGGLTFSQIAEVLEVSANTAASRYRYALEKLRASLGAAETSRRHTG
jgi:RNA polymerase sigma-70 factor (ECF subfamily)